MLLQGSAAASLEGAAQLFSWGVSGQWLCLWLPWPPSACGLQRCPFPGVRGPHGSGLSLFVLTAPWRSWAGGRLGGSGCTPSPLYPCPWVRTRGASLPGSEVVSAQEAPALWLQPLLSVHRLLCEADEGACWEFR